MLWISLRMFEERKNLLNSMLQTADSRTLKKSYQRRVGETQAYIARIRAMLLKSSAAGAEPARADVNEMLPEPRKKKSARAARKR